MGELISGPLLRGLILDIVEDTINRNLNEIVIGSSFVTDNELQAEMALSARVENLSTDLGLGGDNVGNLNVKLSGIFDTIKSDPTINAALGSYHVNDDVLPLPVDDGSSLSVVVNSNMVNQALLAAYNIGITHMTMLNGEVHTGLAATEELGGRGDFRVELNPSSPGQFHLQEGLVDKGYAFLEFHHAQAVVSIKGKNGWSQLTSVDVDIRAGVYLSVEGGYLGMTLASAPELIVNAMSKITHEDSGLSLNVDAEFIRKLVQSAIEHFTPAVTDSVLRIDVSKMGISEDLYTDGISTASGHLEFKQGLKAD